MNHKRITAATSSFAIVSGALAILLSGLGGPAHAAERLRFDEEGPRQQTVRFGDLDLSHPEGRRVLQSRLKRAARNVCSLNALPFAELRLAERRCEVETLRVAMAEVGPAFMIAAAE